MYTTDIHKGSPTYIDAIGVPRGVSDEFKLVNQIAAEFESMLPWVTVNKNVDHQPIIFTTTSND